MNTFSDPNKIIEQFSFSDDHVIADFGTGGGAYSLAFARAHKNDFTAKIYAIDVRQDMLTRLQTLADQEKFSQIKVIWGDIEEPKGSRLRDDSVDMVVMANVLFTLEDKSAAMREAMRVLKADGHLVVIDWAESFGNIGPKEEDVVSFDAALNLVESHGLVFDKNVEAGEHHYGFISRKI